MLFISWSGNPSKEIGEILKRWLESIFDELDIFFSDEMQPGSRWSIELAKKLEDCQVGIFIYTRGNLNSLWMAFEAGALSKSIQTGQVIPLIFGAGAAELTGPLSQFQARRFNKEGLLHILGVINKSCLKSIKTKEYLNNNLNFTWKVLDSSIKSCLDKYENNERIEPNIANTLDAIYDLIQSSPLANPEFSKGIVDLVSQVKASHEDTTALLEQVKTTLRGSYLFIDGEKPAFSALIAATMRARKCIRSTRFSPMSISGNQDEYGQAINTRVTGDYPIEQYMRIISANHSSKLKDIEGYLNNFRGKNFDLFLTKKTSSFEMVTIDEEEVLIHFYGKGQVINSTLSIVGSEVTRNFIKVYEQLVDPNYDPDILKIEFRYMREDELDLWRKRIQDFFESSCVLEKNES